MAAYATVADARTEGVPTTFTDQQIQAQLDQWSNFIEDATRQWFEPRHRKLELDGNNARVLFFPVPIIKIDQVWINGDFVNELPNRFFKVYNRNQADADDRRNPMVKFASVGLGIFDVPDFRYAMRFVIGTRNQHFLGQYGFVESDGTTPKLIKRAVLKMAIKTLQSGGGMIWGEIMNGPPAAGKKVSETTDGHTVSYNAYAYLPKPGNLNGITNDDEVDAIINMFKAPMKISSTAGRGGYDSRW